MSAEILQNATSVVVVDWPTKEVPDSLARAGLEVSVHGGPEPDNWSVQEVGADGEVVGRGTGVAPAHADVVYSFRPLGELGEILEMAKQVGAKTVWLQSGKDAEGRSDPKGCWFLEEDRSVARAAVEDAGFAYVDQPYIGDVARSLT
jgi:sugar phosphate isomerase/epimerase